MELWENVILTGYLLWGSWYDIRKRAVPVGVLFLGGVLAGFGYVCEGAVIFIVWKGFECSRLVALLPGILLLLLSKATKEIGEADGIVLALTGFISRDKNILLILGISLLYIFLYAMFLFCRKRNRSLQIPYLPFLLAAYITAWMTG